MKNKLLILNILLVIALGIMIVICFTKENSTLETIFNRTSIREYTEQEVEQDKVDLLLHAAMSAPTAGNKQPWTFVVIRDKKTLKAISENMNTMKMAATAPLAIVVCGDLNKTFPGDGVDYWIEDTSAASENLLLAAKALDLGAVWCGVYPMKERVEFVQRLLSLPRNIVPLNVIPVGYPAESPTPKDKWNPALIHNEKWSRNK